MRVNNRIYEGELLSTYRYRSDRNIYESISPACIFENILRYVSAKIPKEISAITVGIEIWNSDMFSKVRYIDQTINETYRSNYSGGGSYTFHSLTLDEIQELDFCLFASLFKYTSET